VFLIREAINLKKGIKMNQLNTEKIKTILFGAIGGAVITMIIGFAWGGWVLGSTSMNIGKSMAQDAVIDRLTPICVAQFNHDPEKDKKLIELKEVDRWKADQYVIDQGWANIPFEKDVDSYVAAQCADNILEQNG